MAWVRQHFVADLQGLPDSMVAAGQALLARISPPRWTLEWCLPWWLGSAYGISPSDSRDLILANVQGLGYVRLQDDLVDGRVAGAELPISLTLAQHLLGAALRRYGRLLGRQPAFWEHVDLAMAQWTEATLAGVSAWPASWHEFHPADWSRLAHRGAPLKIGLVGVCLLAGRLEQIETLTEALDHLLLALVLMDHAQDWADDLAAGRFNAFVAYASAEPQLATHRARNRRQVLEMLWLGDEGQGYFGRLQEELQAARRGFEGAGAAALAKDVDVLQEEAGALAGRLVDSTRSHLQHAVAQLLELVSE